MDGQSLEKSFLKISKQGETGKCLGFTVLFNKHTLSAQGTCITSVMNSTRFMASLLVMMVKFMTSRIEMKNKTKQESFLQLQTLQL